MGELLVSIDRKGQAFANRTVLVTGGAQGIGLGIARAFAAEGAKLALVDVDSAKLEGARQELSAVAEVASFHLDVRDRDAFEQVADKVEAGLGPVYVVCNNAGVGGGVNVTSMSYEAWDWVLGINLGGVVNGIQALAPRLMSRGEGHIVNTASSAGLAPVVGAGGFMYAASKYAVVGLSEALAEDMAPHGIGVSVLCPGFVATEIFENTAKWSPMARVMTARKRELIDVAQRALAGATSIDRVGRVVVEGVKANQLYLHTDDSIEAPLRRRIQTILDALPDRTGPAYL